MRFPMDDLRPGDIEKALRALDESANGGKIPLRIPTFFCCGCGFFRSAEHDDGLCIDCWNRNAYWGEPE